MEYSKKKIALISHVNPFVSGSGQHQRVFNTLVALSAKHKNLYLYTLNEELSEKKRVDLVLDLNQNLQIIYLKRNYFFLKPFFSMYLYFGLGKKSNAIIPFIFEKSKELIKKENFDIIIFEYWYLFKLASYLKTQSNFIICDTNDILTNTFKEHLNLKTFFPDFYKKILLKKYRKIEFEKALINFDVLIAINKKEEQIFKKKFPNKSIYYMPMGVKFDNFTTNIESKFIQKNNFEIAYYGGLGFKKNCNDAITVSKSVTDLLNKNIEIQYKIIGSNPSEQIKSLKSENISITGYVENLEATFLNCDLAVIPFSGQYGFRSRIVELMYFGVPVLTTIDGVWGMGFTENENVFLFDENDDLTNKIQELLKNNLLRKKIAIKAQQKVLSEFTFDQTYNKFVEYIRYLK